MTVGVGELSEQAKKLLKVTEESLELAIDKVREGNRLFDICGTVEDYVVGEWVFDRAGVCGARNRDAVA